MTPGHRRPAARCGGRRWTTPNGRMTRVQASVAIDFRKGVNRVSSILVRSPGPTVMTRTGPGLVVMSSVPSSSLLRLTVTLSLAPALPA